jgi:hypothetical protein
MDLRPKRFRKIASPCAVCGKEFFLGRRGGRRREYCSDACRQVAFRNTGRFRPPPYVALRNVKNSPVVSTPSKGKNRGRATARWPLDLVGGRYRGSPSRNVAQAVRRIILSTEVGPEVRRPGPASTPAHYPPPPSDDPYHVPNFLDRRKRREVSQ